MDDFGDYAIAPVDGVDPIIVPHMLLSAMAVRYATRAAIDLDAAFDAARATWHTDWEFDPEPRTMQAAIEAVDSDLQYWTEE